MLEVAFFIVAKVSSYTALCSDVCFQLQIDLEVLSVISKTRDEIRDLRERYLAMRSSEHMTSLMQHPRCSSTSHYLKPRLQVQIVKN